MIDLAIQMSMHDKQNPNTRQATLTPRAPRQTSNAAQLPRGYPHQPGPSPDRIHATPAMPAASAQSEPEPSAPQRPTSGNSQLCKTCGKPFLPSSFSGWIAFPSRLFQPVVQINGNFYHPECVKCHHCKTQITGEHIQDSNGHMYHKGCHKRVFGVICNCCHKSIEGDGKRIEYIQNSFWKERYCKHHRHDGSVHCTGCRRLRAPDSDDIISLGDGRYTCLQCLSSITLDTAAAQPTYHSILEFYNRSGMPLPQVPPLMLVEDSGLNEAADREGRGQIAHGDLPATHTLGLCLIEQVSSVRTGRITRHRSGALSSSTELVPLVRDPNCTILAILVLAGLPEVVTGAVIAHEVMHAWLREHGIRKLHSQVEEGMCQLMSYLWLETLQLQDDPLQERLAAYMKHQIRTHPSEIYGEGFVLALEGFQRHGLNGLIDHIRRTKTFPDFVPSTRL